MKCVLDMFIYDIEFVIYVIYSNGISFFFLLFRGITSTLWIHWYGEGDVTYFCVFFLNLIRVFKKYPKYFHKA